jgi:hypothetical protein
MFTSPSRKFSSNYLFRKSLNCLTLLFLVACSRAEHLGLRTSAQKFDLLYDAAREAKKDFLDDIPRDVFTP